MLRCLAQVSRARSVGEDRPAVAGNDRLASLSGQSLDQLKGQCKHRSLGINGPGAWRNGTRSTPGNVPRAALPPPDNGAGTSSAVVGDGRASSVEGREQGCLE
eukprot:4763872-Alexandrium_andersonii.AAC.1